MNREIFEKLDKFMEGKDFKSEEEMNRCLQEFVLNNNMDLLDDMELGPEVEAYEWLEKAFNAKTEKTQIKYAKKALEIYPDCIEASIFLASFSKNPFEMIRLVQDALTREKERLTREKFFDKKNIGDFYLLYETRNYILGLHTLATMYSDMGMINKAISVCEEIIRLNNEDNLGARYLLMALYAYKEDEKSLKKLNNKYSMDCSLFPLVAFLILYFKKGNYEKAKSYLDEIKKYNKHFVSFFKDEIPESNVDYYSPGDISEVLACVNEFLFLFDSVKNLDYFILNNGVV